MVNPFIDAPVFDAFGATANLFVIFFYRFFAERACHD